MPRFFFHLRRGREREADEIGLEFSSIEAAYLDTFVAARDIWLELVCTQQDPTLYVFEIADAGGMVLMEVPLQEVLDPSRVGHARVAAPRRVNSGASRAKRLAQELAIEIAAAQAALLKSQQILRRSHGTPTV